MTHLQPLPQPIAVWQDFITPNKPETVVIKGEFFSGSFDITLLSTGAPVLTIKAESASLSHRKHVYTPQGQHLCTIRKETWKMGSSHYFAQAPSVNDNDKDDYAGPPHYWDLEIRSGFTGAKNILTFTNVVSGQPDVLFWKNNPVGSHGTVHHRDKDGPVVADIDAEKMKMRKEYHVTCAPGLDLMLVVGMLLSMDDRVKSSNAAATGGVAASSG